MGRTRAELLAEPLGAEARALAERKGMGERTHSYESALPRLLKHHRVHLFEQGMLEVRGGEDVLAIRWDEAQIQDSVDREGRREFGVGVRGGPRTESLVGFAGFEEFCEIIRRGVAEAGPPRPTRSPELPPLGPGGPAVTFKGWSGLFRLGVLLMAGSAVLVALLGVLGGTLKDDGVAGDVGRTVGGVFGELLLFATVFTFVGGLFLMFKGLRRVVSRVDSSGLSLTTPLGTFSHGWHEISYVSLERTGNHLLVYVWTLPDIPHAQRAGKTRHGYYGYEVGLLNARDPGGEVIEALSRFAGARFQRGAFALPG